MQMNAPLYRGGALLQILFAVSYWLRKIFSRKPAGECQSYLGSELRENSGNCVVRGDPPPPTSSVPTVAARQPG